MPKRTDIHSILLIGSGPIVIGQACEFDYSGTQACKALREQGYRVILVNSNPATIMTDPGFADRTYIEPLTAEFVEKIIAAERPDALLPTVGGQTGLNIALELAEAGVLDRYGVELIGAKVEAIKKAEDRHLFKAAMLRIGLELPRSGYARTLAEAEAIRQEIGLPLIIRPSRTLGGTGGSLVETAEEFVRQVTWGLSASPVHEVLIEESIAGWKEFELEVMRDGKDNVVIICSIENFDPMGVHTGDSITVAPAQTLTDKEYQLMRDAAIRIIREIGVDTGGSNIQFAVNPTDGRMVVIEMNPRVSRSSALASKATGFPIAKIAAKLAVGFTLDEIRNEITRETPASFEPTIDYVVTKIPRFTFEKFPSARDELGPQMKSVGEVMAIGRTFKESLQKAIRSLEIDSFGFDERGRGPEATSRAELEEKLCRPNARRLWYIAEAFRQGLEVSDVYALSRIDPWFLSNVKQIVDEEERLRAESRTHGRLSPGSLRKAKQMGFSDVRLGQLTGRTEEQVRQWRLEAKIEPVFKMVDTCGAEFPAYTPYLYSTYEREGEAPPSRRPKIVILGGGPNRIGQGIEFDYCCVHAAFALREDGFETVMVNCNPETVSTDYDTSDRLYFEPLTIEDVLAIVQREQPHGVIVQFGGQTPLKLAVPLEKAGVRILGTSPDAIDRAEDRQRFAALLRKLGLRQPPNGTALSVQEALRIAQDIGYPVLVRPSYVLGGRAMEIVYEDDGLRRYMEKALDAAPGRTILIDKFLDDAIELDVDALCDGKRVVIGGIMEHIERAGVHSGDSACVLPTISLPARVVQEIRRQTAELALELGVIGLMNVQFAVKGSDVYVLEVNPRASRTVPFVSKAIGVPLAKMAARVMAGKTLDELGLTHEIVPPHISVKEAVFPFSKFPGVDTLLGPEMKSTGEVMGIDASFGAAFAKAQIAAGNPLPTEGTVFISVRDEDKPAALSVARRLARSGFHLLATRGTAAFLSSHGLAVEAINKVPEGSPHCVDAIRAGKVQIVINTPQGHGPQLDSFSIRRSALECRVAYFTTIAGAEAAAEAVELLRRQTLTVKPLQEHYLHAAQTDPRAAG
ncbi:MAG: carbamoyl-phosphate synthase (glutamine-hydrolyzing) [Candidatus Binatia bacterium]|nr:MAG: carbamoyl-phosphate synthase (glutamine-hydrolyzing) [Candidatus Binatia bacterium]